MKEVATRGAPGLREIATCGAPGLRVGSALLAVLLLMALMLTLLLYFVSLVRMESELGGFRRRQTLTDVAINRAVAEALADLDDALGDRPMLTESEALERVSTGSGGTATNGVADLDPADFGWPDSYYRMGSGWLQTLAGRAAWEIDGDTNGVHTTRAWVAVNLTGLLDPMGVGDLDTSHLGFVPEAIPEVYLSAREFMLAHSNATPVFVPGNFSRDRGRIDPDTWTWNTNATVGAEIPGMNPLLWNSNQVRAVFAERYPDRDADLLTAAFLDFREGRETPTHPDGLTAVPVPMFNELTASLTVSNLGDQVTLTHRLNLEVWRPYPGNADTNRYRVASTPPLTARTPDSVPAEAPSRSSDGDWEFAAPGGEPDQAFGILSLLFQQNAVAMVEGQTVSLDWDFDGLELERTDGPVVDRLPAGLRLSLPDVVIPGSGLVEEVEVTLAVEDPRLNHDPARWGSAAGPSLAGINPAATAAAAADPLADGFACWTPAGRAGEWEEAWIGHFPLDAPWRSVDLFGDDGRWWLRHTRRPDWEPGRWTRARVNPNGWNTNAVAAVFADVAPAPLPGQTATVLTLEQAGVLAENLAAAVELGEGTVQRADWTEALETDLTAADTLGFERHAAESVVAQTLDRFDAGTQLWGLLVAAEVRAADGRVLARRRERLLWWMEAFPPPDGGPRGGRVLLRVASDGK